MIDTLLDRPGPKPAIVIHGDHGPGSMLRWRFAPVVTLFDPGVWTESRYERSRCEVYVPVQSVGVGAHRPAG